MMIDKNLTSGKPDDQLINLFHKHCYSCPKFIYCLNTFHAVQTNNCEHWEMFVEITTSIESYIQECIYTELTEIKKENRPC